MAKSRDAFRTISEVAEWLDIQAHVLRFWESKFTQVKPVKRAGGRRYYRRQDMLLLGGIKKLLHDDGMTIKGAQKLLREEGIKYVASLSRPVDSDEADIIDAVAIPTPADENVAETAPEIGETASENANEPEALEAQADDVSPEPTPSVADTAETVEEIAPVPAQGIAEQQDAVTGAFEQPSLEPALTSSEDSTTEASADEDDFTPDTASSDFDEEVLENFLVNLRHVSHIHPAQAAEASSLVARFAKLFQATQESEQA
ncbi:MerR-like DNA binding protein [Shimia isoporae]|uniref:MerR-like DNA binding protein n=1 Tax=Shimia isoporae TaxID=647720 RepID=A0A4R1NMQ2_9RHOB|nr:MerR family transcriptional regulator [Shimia isoporae]TCL09697.1 MerR-like DNA binding protein [Shimia isoporae]